VGEVVFGLTRLALATMAAIEAKRPVPRCKTVHNTPREGASMIPKLAERGGFEPPVELVTLRRFSKPLLSTTQPPLRLVCSRPDFKMVAWRGMAQVPDNA
jgi:hypothetical protein